MFFFASFHTVLDFGPTSHQGCHRQQFVVKKKKKSCDKATVQYHLSTKQYTDAGRE